MTLASFILLLAFSIPLTTFSSQAESASTSEGRSAYNQPVYAVGGQFPGAIRPSLHLALVVGNNDYRGNGRLYKAGSDATKVADALKARGYLLIGGDVQTNVNLERLTLLLAKLNDVAASMPGALVVIYFAGHGHIEAGQTMIDPTSSDEIRQDIQGISVLKVIEELNKSKTMLNVLFLDNCRNIEGGFGASYAPMKIPKNTFIGHSTRPGGIASDETGYYADLLSKRLRSGFDTLADLHLKLTTDIYLRRVHQVPVFSVSSEMPNRPVAFYPISSNVVDVSLVFPNDPGSHLARSCDRLTKWWELAAAREKMDPLTPFGEICVSAWKSGWRSKEVMRGVGFTTFFVHSAVSSSPVIFGLVNQASEMADGTASMYYLLETMTGASPEDIEAAIGESPSRQSRLYFDLLFERGLSMNDFDLNSIYALQDAAIRSVLTGNDFSAVIRVVAALGYGLRPSIHGRVVVRPDQYRDIIKQALVSRSISGPSAAVGYLVYADDMKNPIVSKRELREFLWIRFKSGPATDEYEYKEREFFAAVGRLLFYDLLQGKYELKNEAQAMEVGRKMERMFPYLTSPGFRANGPEICLKLAISMLSGRTPDGSRALRDAPNGRRLLRYAVSKFVPGAIEAAYHFHIDPK